MNASNTQFGFEFGPATVERIISQRKGWVLIDVRSPKPKETVEVYMTKTGKTRVYKNGVELT